MSSPRIKVVSYVVAALVALAALAFVTAGCSTLPRVSAPAGGPVKVGVQEIRISLATIKAPILVLSAKRGSSDRADVHEAAAREVMAFFAHTLAVQPTTAAVDGAP